VLQHDPQLDFFPGRNPSALYQARTSDEQQHPSLPPCLDLPTGNDGNWGRELTKAVAEGVGVEREGGTEGRREGLFLREGRYVYA
jgi:hypothetical protein